MIRQNRTKLQFILGGMLMLSLAGAACNNSGEKKDTPAVETKIETPPPVVRDSTDTMEVTPGKVAPVVETKPK